MLKILFFIFFSKSTPLEKTLLEECNLEKIKTEINEINYPKDLLFSYFVKSFFLENRKEGLYDLICMGNENEVFKLVYISNVLDTDNIHDDESVIATYQMDICKKISRKYLKNSYKYVPKAFFSDIDKKGGFDRFLNNILTLVYALDEKCVNAFFRLLDSKKIFIGDYLDVLKFLARKNVSRAYGYLGEVYLYGIGVQKSVDKAMDYYLKGKIGGDVISYNGIGKVLMSDKYEDFTSAKHHLEYASISNTLNETDYHIYLIYKNHLKMPQYGLFYLSKSLTLGYLSAIYKDGEKFFRKKDFSSTIIRLSPIIDFNDTIIYYQKKALHKYKAKEYKSCLMYTLLSVELGSKSSIKNAIYLLQNYRLIENQDKILFDLYMRQIRDSSFENLPRVGDAYYYGLGVKQSYKDAFAYYIASAACKSVEGIISLSYMYEKGLGVERNYDLAIRTISKIKLDDKTYLLVVYIFLYITVKFLIYSLFNIYVLISFISLFIAVSVYNKLQKVIK